MSGSAMLRRVASGRAVSGGSCLRGRGWDLSRAVTAAPSRACRGRVHPWSLGIRHLCGPAASSGQAMTVARPSSRGGGTRAYSATPRAPSGDYPPHTLYPLPALSPTMASGSIASWSLAEGDAFGPGQVLCTVETDKASVDFEAQDDGVLARILVGAGAAEVPVGAPICVVVEDAALVAAFAEYVAPAAVAATGGPEAGELGTVAASAAPVAPPDSGSSILLPSARYLAESKGLDATGLVGSGKGGRVTKGDVLQAMSDGKLPALPAKGDATSGVPPGSAPIPPPTAMASAAPLSLQDLVAESIQTSGAFEDIPNNKMRKIIASRLTDSKRNVPHFYTAMPVCLDSILQLRKILANELDLKISVNDFVIKCSAMALRDVPQVNATIVQDQVRLIETVDISVAVATPTGLITPIVFNTDKLGLADITRKVKDLAGRARDGKLAPEEYQGGSFSISNLGMFGIDEFSAVINPPQAAILAVGGGSRRVVPTPFVLDAVEQAKPSIQTIMTARLSSDRRVVDEPTASLFLSAFRQYINEPELLML